MHYLRIKVSRHFRTKIWIPDIVCLLEALLKSILCTACWTSPVDDKMIASGSKVWQKQTWPSAFLIDKPLVTHWSQVCIPTPNIALKECHYNLYHLVFNLMLNNQYWVFFLHYTLIEHGPTILKQYNKMNMKVKVFIGHHSISYSSCQFCKNMQQLIYNFFKSYLTLWWGLGGRNHLHPTSALYMGAYNAKNGPRNGLAIQLRQLCAH